MDYNQILSSLGNFLDKDTLKEFLKKNEETEKNMRGPIENGSLKFKVSQKITGKMKNELKKVIKLCPKNIEDLKREFIYDNQSKETTVQDTINHISSNSDFTANEVYNYLIYQKEPENDGYEAKLDIYYLEFFKVFLLVDGLKPEEVELIQSDVSKDGIINDFWLNFDITEVRNKVNFFRQSLSRKG